MKKGISLVVLILLAALIFSGCSGASPEADSKIKIVATIFPEYDWVRNIIGPDNDRIELTLLVDTGADIHSYQPTAEDIVTLSTCDMLVYIGGESEEWLDDVLKNSKNSKMIAIDLLEVLGDSAFEEEIKEGMETEHGNECPEAPEYDEHIWLSLKNAVVLCNHIAGKLEALDPDNKELYSSNVKQYTDKLSALDEEYRKLTSEASQRVVLFGDRFPFRYMFEDYGISYYAAFAGCSAETEASFKTVAFLADKVDELGLKTIVKLENSPDSIAVTVRDSTASKDQQILSLDSLQSTSLKDIEGGKTYLSAMESNLALLCEAMK